MKPQIFNGDTLSYLAIRSAASRLAYETDVDSVARVVELLWDTALRLEEGNLPLAMRNLQQAQRNLENVLNNPEATNQEVARAMEEFKQALAEYFQELYLEMQKRMAQSGTQMQVPPEMFQNLVTPEDVQSFLDELQAEALSGDRESARELLSELQKFMDMMNQSTEMAMPPQMDFMMEGINELQELIEKQKELRDQTQKHANQSNNSYEYSYPEVSPFDNDLLEQWGIKDMPPPPDRQPQNKAPSKEIDTSEHKVEQDSLRYILGQLMLEADEKLGEIPENMGLAEREMRNAADQLARNQPLQAIPHQDKAIEHLQDAMQDMSEQMQQMMKSMALMAMGGMGQLDPLGRPMDEGDNPGLFPGSRVKIPEEAERKRVQEILRILRKRSGELNRPDYELEYYRRLMKKF